MTVVLDSFLQFEFYVSAKQACWPQSRPWFPVLGCLLIMRFSSCDLMRFAYGRYALGAFNVGNLEQLHGLFRGATRARAPIIIQFTRMMREYVHPTMLEQVLRA